MSAFSLLLTAETRVSIVGSFLSLSPSWGRTHRDSRLLMWIVFTTHHGSAPNKVTCARSDRFACSLFPAAPLATVTPQKCITAACIVSTWVVTSDSSERILLGRTHSFWETNQRVLTTFHSPHTPRQHIRRLLPTILILFSSLTLFLSSLSFHSLVRLDALCFPGRPFFSVRNTKINSFTRPFGYSSLLGIYDISLEGDFHAYKDPSIPFPTRPHGISAFIGMST